MSDEIIPLNGHVRIRAWEKQPDGTEIVVKDDTIKNLIVNVGKDSILKYLGNVSGGENAGGGRNLDASESGVGGGDGNTKSAAPKNTMRN